MVRTLRVAIVAALLLGAGNAWALGLGQIEVKSRRNQPLLAEIPIVSTTPGELEALQARLASPETFRRVGLAPPSGIAADLKFSLGSDARGRPVIRVTTVNPVDQAVLNFLIEVDWGQGRLVREYSALVDAPNTASTALQPDIAAPVLAQPNVVQRPASAAPALPAEPPMAAPPALPPVPTAIEAAPSPISAAAPVAVVPTPKPAPAPAPATAVAIAEYGPVKRGETLSVIAGRLGLSAAHSLDQAMLALLRANPDAFLGNDINRLKHGAVLRVPEAGEVGGIAADEAALVVREQMRQWRQARRTVAQPVATAPEAAPLVDGNIATPAARGVPVQADATAAETDAKPHAKPDAPKTATPAARRQQARLEIVPPSTPGKATETRSGTTAGGEGSMLQQQLRQRDEDIAAKTSEIGELKERVAQLEKLQQQQQQMITLKDSELAAAQQRLADSRMATPTAAAPAASVQATQASEPAQAANAMPWLWGGLAMIALAMLAWLFVRRSPKPAPPRRVFDSEALAASLVLPAEPGVPAADAAVAPDVEDPLPEPPPVHTVVELADVPVAAPRADSPNWHSGWTPAAAPAVAEAPRPRFVPDEPSQPPAPKASAGQRMKLARAFLDIGDDHSARELLRELLDDADPAARDDAARMLRELD